MVLVGVLRFLGCLENVLQLPALVWLKGLFAQTLLGLLFLELACVAFPLTVKVALPTFEPAQWKGAALAHFQRPAQPEESELENWGHWTPQGRIQL